MTHFCAVFSFPVWSDDLYRYVYEGRALRSGWATPYEISPALGMTFVHDDVRERVNHPEICASYPPFWQLAGYVLAKIGDGIQAPFIPFRVLFLLCDVGVAWLLLRRRGRRAFFCWMLHPLPFIELAHGAHLDALGIFLVLASLLLVEKKAFLRGVLCGFAVGIKPIAAAALFALPFFAPEKNEVEAEEHENGKTNKSSSRRKIRLPFFFGMLFGIALPTLPFALADAPIFEGLSEYGQRWEAQPTGFALLKWPLSSLFTERANEDRYAHLHLSRSPLGLLVEENGRIQWQFGDAKKVARPVLLDDRLIARGFALLLMGAAFLWLLKKRKPDITRAVLVLLWFFLFAPAVHPWYLLWPLALILAAQRRGWLDQGLWLSSALSPLAYQAVVEFRVNGHWQEAIWPRVVVLIAFIAPWCVAKIQGQRRTRIS
ncbi:MAG: hypothetical protein GY822_01620 [Deltaproteobacteria bacterium]|nr:hypothetical protein [Deltaproteobacteria bacterium]